MFNMQSSNTCYNSGLGSFQKWHIGNDVRTILLEDEAIVARVGDNIYPIVAPENTIGEFIVYAREKYSKATVKEGVYQDECILILTAVSDNYDKAIELAALIDNAVTGKHVNPFGEKFTAVLADSSETFDDNKFIETLSFEIK